MSASDSPRILVFTGNGKGKTTAALGMALRAVGHGMRVAVVRFVKADTSVGEITPLADMQDVDVFTEGMGFIPKQESPNFAMHCAAAADALKRANEILEQGDHQLLILDEVCVAVNKNLLAERDVLDVLALAAPGTCVVMTGRGATPGLIDLADTVTDMTCVKHGYDQGIPAQPGVEC